MALLVFHPDGSPKNELAARECEKWHASTFEQLTARKTRIRKILAGKAKPAKRSLEPRNCGTGAGGFKLDNTCAKGGDGEPSSDKPSQPEKRPEGGYTDKIRGAIDKEMAARGLDPEKSYTRARGLLDLPAAEVVQSIAAEQQAQNGKPLSKEAKESYDAFKYELLDQYNALVEAGLRPIPFEGKGEPYNAGPDKLWTPSSEVMRKEVERTGDFYFFKTQTGFGEEGSKPTEGHPLLEVSPAKDANGSPLLWNDVFRVVHDNVAHIRGGFGFNTKGEMNGMIAHASTLTPAARPALFAETFAQNAVYETTKKFAAQNAFAPSPASMAVLDDLLVKSGELTGTNQRAMPDEDRDDDEDMPTGPGRLRRQPHGDDASEVTELEADDEGSESRNCGTGAGGFKPGNTCAAGGDGEGGVTTEEQPPQSANDSLNRNKPTDTVYDPTSLIEKGPPSEYEGGYLKDGQTLWDRFSMPSSSGVAGKLDEIQVAQELAGLYERPYEDDSQAKRKEIEGELPLRKQHQELMDAGAAALGWNDPVNSSLDEVPHSDVWVAAQFSSSVTNELMAEMSRTSRTEEQQKELDRLLGVQEAVNSEESKRVTQADVDRLSTLARETQLPDGITLFHGMAGVNGRDLLDSMARTRGEFSLNKLTSTTIRPSVAAQFADGTDFTGKVPPENKVAGGEMIHADGTLGSVVRILNAPRGLPIAAASLYQNEAEVVLAPGTRLRFTGDHRVVFIPAGNDSGWPAKTFEPKGSVWGKDHARALYPMKVYDAEVVE